MFKIKLDTPIISVKGTPMTFREFNQKTKKEEEKGITIRDYLILLLSSRFMVMNNKEIFWATSLGTLFADDKNKEVEVSDEKRQFLSRLITSNKVRVPNPMGGEREQELFAPFEQGQLLKAVMTEDEMSKIENG